jgi:hypothetical protein
MDRTALIVVDVQRGFDDAGFWGPRNNTACEENASALIAARRANDQPNRVRAALLGRGRLTVAIRRGRQRVQGCD